MYLTARASLTIISLRVLSHRRDALMKVGIDLGTTYSVVARYDRKSASAEIIRNKYLKDITPSVICFLEDGSVLIGEEAKALQEGGVGVIASIFKVNMGTKEVCATNNGREYHAEELSKLMLRELIKEAEASAGEKIDSAVITVPAYFDDLQRTATRSAAEKAGIKVSKIINEPTAAAIYYGYKHSDGKTLLVYDLGGGTFDVTIVNVNNSTNLLAQQCLSERGYIGNFAFIRVSLCGTNNHKSFRTIFSKFQIHNRYTRTHLNYITAAGFDDIRITDFGLQILNLTFQECLFVFRIIVLGVL